jgi:hypothetical protein
MIKINEHLAKDILAHLECDTTELCTACRLEHADCDDSLDTCAKRLRDALEAAEQNESVSRETVATNEALPAEPGQASKYITIPVAEYHFLTKAATLLEIILADKSYSPNTVVAAVRTVVQEMVQQAEAGAAE